MKTRGLIAFSLLIVCGLLFTNAAGPYRQTYIPVFMERSELEKSVVWKDEARELGTPGKIYSNDSYIYINEQYQGIHIINNTNPANPRNEAFIVAPGCIDMAIKGDIMYLDNSVDLVAFSLREKEVTHRIKDVFPEPLAPTNQYYFTERPDNFILVGWKINDGSK